MTVEITFKRKRYVSEAQEVIKELKTSGFRVGKDTLTSTQIRNLLASTTPLYDAARTQRSESYDDRISATRINAVYQSGRNQAVKKLVISSKMLIILEIITREKDGSISCGSVSIWRRSSHTLSFMKDKIKGEDLCYQKYN